MQIAEDIWPSDEFPLKLFSGSHQFYSKMDFEHDPTIQLLKNCLCWTTVHTVVTRRSTYLGRISSLCKGYLALKWVAQGGDEITIPWKCSGNGCGSWCHGLVDKGVISQSLHFIIMEVFPNSIILWFNDSLFPKAQDKKSTKHNHWFTSLLTPPFCSYPSGITTAIFINTSWVSHCSCSLQTPRGVLAQTPLCFLLSLEADPGGLGAEKEAQHNPISTLLHKLKNKRCGSGWVVYCYTLSF